MGVHHMKNQMKNPWYAGYTDKVTKKRVRLGSYASREEAEAAYAEHAAAELAANPPPPPIPLRDGYATAQTIGDHFAIDPVTILRSLSRSPVPSYRVARRLQAWDFEVAKIYLEMSLPKILAKAESAAKYRAKLRCGTQPTQKLFSLPPLEDFRKVAQEFRDNNPWR